MLYAIAYAATLVAFLAVDAVWLYKMGSVLYRPTLGDILLESPRFAPAVVFYLIYPIGVLAFAVAPALKAESVLTAIGWGALFGALAYATYDLTNYATLRNWTLQITLADIAWGAVLTGVAAAAGYGAAAASRHWMAA
ncbi:DUF2177 family protein [Rhodoplanes sp. TEM]|uniref:DUF2177 family protein n=1 Tax=Rhodoplanes tepidamans TaxID=200616 RepID=A0ABT5JG91_RHOTP|nr:MULTISPECIES: DUF2177 family protein [Rhodoplanes]MDC7788592.1 DUF2177 family protein [Rhodoplanes tepidamans]MDC7986848.1 DUF2177 family protein [Rhodoplanes sp. TEM]MDQ0358575.1 putative membrane protein [Rhodoplanes tepidamans]